MIELTEPLAVYPPVRERHRELVSDYFESLVRASGVDEELNEKTATELRTLEGDIRVQTVALRNVRILQGLALLTALGLAFAVAAARGAYLILELLALGGVVLALNAMRPRVRALKESKADLNAQHQAKAAEAAAQMAPLNQLHSWGVARAFFQQALPDVQFDRILTAGTVSRLYSDFGLPPQFTDGRSMLALQSGRFRGNPFVFARYLHHWIGSRTYSGSIVIHWTEQERDSNGNLVTTQRSQTLTATVVKPFPSYTTNTLLLYGHEAVPSLSFSRTSSWLSGLDAGVVNDWLKDRAVGRVERKARRAVSKGTSGFTVMSNAEFETQFKALDRNDEVEFRLLFTPLAQQSMVELLNDRTIGYGDDFGFTKAGPLSCVEATHLAETDIDPDPRIFSALSVADARRFFCQFHDEYFRSLFFSFAPLWTIPMFSDTPSSDVCAEPHGGATSSTWEHEAIANYIGEQSFRHPASVTSNVLRASSMTNPDGVSIVTVNAHGYQGVPQVDIVRVRGGDGNIHPVAVHWTEFLPVAAQTTMLVAEVGDPVRDAHWVSAKRAQGAAGPEHHRGQVVAALLS